MRAPGRRVLLRCPVRAMLVVVIGVLAQDQPQVPFAGDQHPVQALAAGAGDPAFGDRVRAGCLDRLYRFKTHRMASDLRIHEMSYAAW